MKLKYLILSLLLFTLDLNAQQPTSIKFDETSFQLKSSLKAQTSNIDELIAQINSLAKSDTQRIFMVAGWFYDNMAFDISAFESGNSQNSYQSVLKNKRGICSDYADLFSAFCNKLSIKNELIEGYVQELGENKTTFETTNHVWNAVKLGDEWFHCDLLWMSGKLKEGNNLNFEKILDESMLLTQSSDFYKTHIPADPIWQLTNQPSTIESLLGIETSKTTNIPDSLNYKSSIADYSKLSKQNKSLLFADHAFAYNRENAKVVVVNYFNAAIAILNKNSNDPKQLKTAKDYLNKSKTYLPQTSLNGTEFETQLLHILKTISK